MRFKISANGASLGVTRLIEESHPDALDYAQNRAYFCQQCGNVWARWELEDKPLSWYAFHRSCGEHPRGLWSGDRPGSLILYPSDVTVVSREVLEYEVNRPKALDRPFWEDNGNEASEATT